MSASRTAGQPVWFLSPRGSTIDASRMFRFRLAKIDGLRRATVRSTYERHADPAAQHDGDPHDTHPVAGERAAEQGEQTRRQERHRPARGRVQTEELTLLAGPGELGQERPRAGLSR